MIRYVFAQDAVLPFKVPGEKPDPQVIGEALAKIAARDGGELKARAVVADARSKRSPIHKFFEWDDGKAASLYRVDQARALIQSIRTEDTNAMEEFRYPRAWENVQGAYHSIGDIKKSVDLREALLASAHRELLSFESRYQALKEICEGVAVVRKKLSKRIAEHESRAAT